MQVRIYVSNEYPTYVRNMSIKNLRFRATIFRIADKSVCLIDKQENFRVKHRDSSIVTAPYCRESKI